MSAPAKDARLHIRCDREMRRLLDKGAAYAHMSVSEFVLRNAVEQAHSVVQAHEAIALSQDDFIAFLGALDGPAQPNPACSTPIRPYAAMETVLVIHTALTYNVRDVLVRRNAALHPARLRLPV